MLRIDERKLAALSSPQREDDGDAERRAAAARRSVPATLTPNSDDERKLIWDMIAPFVYLDLPPAWRRCWLL